MLTVWLPLPPSANRLWRAYQGRNIKSQAYRTWLAEAAKTLLIQRPGSILGKFTAVITVERPDRRRRDIDNLAKPVLDALKFAQVIEDDSLAQRIVLEWAADEPVKDAQVIVQISEGRQ